MMQAFSLFVRTHFGRERLLESGSTVESQAGGHHLAIVKTKKLATDFLESAEQEMMTTVIGRALPGGEQWRAASLLGLAIWSLGVRKPARELEKRIATELEQPAPSHPKPGVITPTSAPRFCFLFRPP